MIRGTAFLFLLGLAAVNCEDHWAVLVAGSNGYFNYRHQADVCHAYQLLTQRGFHPDRIITMMYDDVASSELNPFPGKLYNFPWKTEEEAKDVYKGCKLDYTNRHVTPEKFLAVLTGDEKVAGGKVLRSTADDHVFVNFVDHGGVGLIAFPDGAEVLHANKLNRALKQMHESNMYKQLVFYLETCESGSMFEGILPKNISAYAVTAANAKESSWGTFCGEDAKVGGKMVRSCLGDLFSVNWMMDSEKHSDETLGQQFHSVKEATNKSHVKRYGSWKVFEGESISEFQGPPEGLLAGPKPPVVEERLLVNSAVNARDVKLHQLYHNYAEEGTDDAAEMLMAEIRERQQVKALGLQIAAQALGSTHLAKGLLSEQAPEKFVWTQPACHERAVEAFSATCGWNENRLTLSKVLYQLCERSQGDETAILGALRQACPSKDPLVTAEVWA